ncbi:PKD domain protein, partial [Ostertagia ostertagi]
MGTTSYIGDYAHFLSTRSLGGGIAYLLSNPCTTAKQFKSAVSAINNTYFNFPTYSWTVEVVTHELGHNLGSNHTQWCGWVGGALDNCYTTEGGCSPGPQPSNGGTIMSYCHLTSTQINFNNGFGQQPGDRIRQVIGSSSSCLGVCRMTISVTKQDASCGQNNGSATVTAVDGTGTAGFCTGGSLLLSSTNNAAYTYVWRKDGNIIAGATSSSYMATVAGTYAVTATSGACSGTQTVVVSVVPPPVANIVAGGVTTFCEGSSVLLNGNAGGAYTYQWYNNGTPVPGANGTSYNATTSGNYTIKISAGAGCEVTSAQVGVTVNPTPQATISAASVTSFCAGGSVRLNASSGSNYGYQWYRNGNILSGETQSTYTANTSGSYTVQTTIGTCSKTSAATNITVWANPVVTVSPVNVTIEKFQAQTLTAGGASSYNWLVQPAM